MAVEKMKIISIIGKLCDFDRVSRFIVLDGNTHILNALSELNSNYFSLSASEEHLQALQELSILRAYNSKRDFSKDEAVVESFHSLFDMKPEIKEEYLDIVYDYAEMQQGIRERYDTVKETFDRIKTKQAGIQKMQGQIENLSYLHSSTIEINRLNQMKYMKARLLMFTIDSFKKLEANLENIPSVILEYAVLNQQVVLLTLTPETLLEDAERIFASLNYTELDLPVGYSGTAEQVIKKLSQKIEQEKAEIEALKESAGSLKQEYGETIKRAYSMIELEKQVESVKVEAAIGHNLFFVFGFVPQSSLNSLQAGLKATFGEDIIMIVEDVDSRRAGHAPPTRIKNNWLFKPFESLVTMYGIPNYNEQDPTAFFALTYMLLFGAMFGDIGQGLLILLGGLYLNHKKGNKSFGGILSRLGASSMLFGSLYGSVFGTEELIPALLIRPMANINTMLMSAVVLGVVMITVGYLYSLVNHFRTKNLEEGLFGKEGVVGFLFFWTLILTVGGKTTGYISVPTGAAIGILAVLLLLMVFKQPLANKLAGHHALYDEAPADYYIEAGFGMIETLLSVLSNVISFIRVGAFALNHVGLYIAFATMAEMIHSEVGGIIILIVGNIVIIGLEGLIVFIQSLRLEYYELFSKYYTGYGVEYRPASLFNRE